MEAPLERFNRVRMLMRAGVGLLLVSVGAGGAASVSATMGQVQFAGFAVTGDAAGANSNVQVLDELLKGELAIARNQRLLEAILAEAPADFALATDGLARLDGSTSAVAVAAAIDRETVSVEAIAGQYKLVSEIAGQALFFDFRERQVIASVPVTVQHIDILATEPGEDEKAAALRRLLDVEGPYGVVANMAAAIATARIPEAAGLRMQLVELGAAEGALDAYPELARRVASGVAGHEFSKLFVSGTGLSLLPYRAGQAIGGAMAARFADGSVYNLSIPDTDYAIRVRIDRVAKRAVEQNAALERRLYGVFFHMVVEEPLSGRRYIDQPLRQGATKVIPASQANVDDASAFYDTLLEGFASVAAASQGRGDDWLAEQPGGRAARSQWNDFKDLIETCR